MQPDPATTAAFPIAATFVQAWQLVTVVTQQLVGQGQYIFAKLLRHSVGNTGCIRIEVRSYPIANPYIFCCSFNQWVEFRFGRNTGSISLFNNQQWPQFLVEAISQFT